MPSIQIHAIISAGHTIQITSARSRRTGTISRLHLGFGSCSCSCRCRCGCRRRRRRSYIAGSFWSTLGLDFAFGCCFGTSFGLRTPWSFSCLAFGFGTFAFTLVFRTLPLGFGTFTFTLTPDRDYFGTSTLMNEYTVSEGTMYKCIWLYLFELDFTIWTDGKLKTRWRWTESRYIMLRVDTKNPNQPRVLTSYKRKPTLVMASPSDSMIPTSSPENSWRSSSERSKSKSSHSSSPWWC